MITFSQSIKLAQNTGNIHPIVYKLYLSFLTENWKRPNRVRLSLLDPSNYILEPGSYCLFPAMNWFKEKYNQQVIKERRAKIKSLIKKRTN